MVFPEGQLDLSFGKASIVSVTGLGNARRRATTLSIFQVSRNRLAIYTQSIANITLAAWLYNEYVHNVFMQQYLANLWASLGIMITVGVSVIAATIGGIMLYARTRSFSLSVDTQGPSQNLALSALSPIDMCPICNSPLRTLSANRVQCRKCKRYFKK